MGFGKDGKGVIIRDHDIVTLGTLATLAALKQDNPLAITEDFRMLKASIFASLSDASLVEGDGPLIIGICDDELTAAEIAECMTASGPLDPSDNLRNERAMRPVFPLAQMSFLPLNAGGHSAVKWEEPIVSKQAWTYSNANGWAIFIFNAGDSGLTTGGIVTIDSTFFGVWVK